MGLSKDLQIKKSKPQIQEQAATFIVFLEIPAFSKTLDSCELSEDRLSVAGGRGVSHNFKDEDSEMQRRGD